jgi:arabinogalactan oligomer/maltooligosaccharide transport system substrate-binding protein
VAAASLLATACSGGETAEETANEAEPSAESTEGPAVRGDEDLVIWADPVRFEYVQEVANQFGEENGITVGVQGIVAVREDLITANAAGNGPDVVVGAHDWLGQLVQNGTVEPLQLSPDALAQYSETAVQAWTYNGQVYAVPYAVESVALYCNTEFAPDTYATIEDVIAAGQPGVDAGQLEVPLILQQGELGDAYHMQPTRRATTTRRTSG